MFKPVKPLILTTLLLLTSTVWADCNSVPIHIYRLKNNKVVDKGIGQQHFCSSPSSVAEGWDFKRYQTTLFKTKSKPKKNKRHHKPQIQESYKVNRKNATFIGKTVQGKMMRCLVFGRNEMLCNPYPNANLKKQKVKRNKGKSRTRRR